MFKKLLLLGLFIIGANQTFAQSGTIEANTGGFSFIPAFASTNPHFILNLNTNNKKRLSGHIISNIRMQNGIPTNIIFIGRYKVIDQKFKLIVGYHIPAVQINDDFTVKSFRAQEITASYPLTNSFTFSTFFLHGEGTNFDFNANLFCFNGSYNKKNFNFLTQYYLLNLDNTYGVSETISYKLSNKFSLKGFINKTLSNGDTKWTLGLNYKL